MNTFTWRWSNPNHLEAHRADFRLPPEDVLEKLTPLVAADQPDPLELETVAKRNELVPFHKDFELDVIVGVTGLLEVDAAHDDSFWAYRRGRNIPSHLCVADKEPTRWVCLWGGWTTGEFVIHTLYPGRVAPREIHDPEITLAELPRAVEFWRAHAIIVDDGQYRMEPDA